MNQSGWASCILFILLLIGCNSADNKSNVISIENFKYNDSICGESMNMSNVLIDPHRIYLKNSFLIFNESSSDKQLTLASVSEGKIINNLIAKGKGPGELLSVFHIACDDSSSKIFAHDIVQNKLLELSPDSLNGLNYDPSELIDFNKYGLRVLCPAMIDDTTFILTGLFSNTRLVKMTKTGCIDSLGCSPDLADGRFDEIINQAYDGILKYNKKNNKAVIGNRYTDKIEIIDIATNDHKFIKGPALFEPAFTEKNIMGSMALVHSRTEYYGYIDICLTDDYIIALYSGRNNDEIAMANYGNIIRIFSWTGEALYNLTTDRYLFSICIDKNEIYAVSLSAEPEIYKYKLPI